MVGEIEKNPVTGKRVGEQEWGQGVPSVEARAWIVARFSQGVTV